MFQPQTGDVKREGSGRLRGEDMTRLGFSECVDYGQIKCREFTWEAIIIDKTQKGRTIDLRDVHEKGFQDASFD